MPTGERRSEILKYYGVFLEKVSAFAQEEGVYLSGNIADLLLELNLVQPDFVSIDDC
jgi:hypothetical protein